MDRHGDIRAMDTKYYHVLRFGLSGHFAQTVT